VKRAVVLDADLALVFSVDLTGKGSISWQKRLQAYSDADFAIVSEAIESAAENLTIPSIPTEASNLMRHARDPLKSELLAAMKNATSGSREAYAPATAATRMPELQWLGLADCAILALPDEQTALLTADKDLFAVAAGSGRHAVLFDSLR